MALLDFLSSINPFGSDVGSMPSPERAMFELPQSETVFGRSLAERLAGAAHGVGTALGSLNRPGEARFAPATRLGRIADERIPEYRGPRIPGFSALPPGQLREEYARLINSVKDQREPVYRGNYQETTSIGGRIPKAKLAFDTGYKYGAPARQR